MQIGEEGCRWFSEGLVAVCVLDPGLPGDLGTAV